jgi:hypothetical protein
MLEIVSYTPHGKPQRHDLHALPIADATLPHKLEQIPVEFIHNPRA